MTITYITAQDSVNPDNIPANVLACGYDTGGPAWNAAGFAAHLKPYPAIHVDQDPNASDPLADFLDVEAQAATPAEIVNWVQRAREDYNSGARPGQRWPGIYCTMNSLDGCVTNLQDAGLTNVPFWTAQPGIGLAAGITRVTTATGPYPCVGVQYNFSATVDYDVFSLPWVMNVSHAPSRTITQSGWEWCHKCQGLFYGPGMARSACPAGGTHDDAGSGNYSLSDLVP